MQTKLTLRLDEVLINEAKHQAKQSGKSVSQMVADYFALLGKKEVAFDLPPITRSLKGILNASSVEEIEYHRHLEEKYL